MHRRIFFFDIDGTLIDMENKIYRPTPATVESFRQLHEQGDYVVLATGRAKALTPPEVMELGFDGYIFSNGGYVSFHDKVLSNSILTVSEMKKLDEYADLSDASLMLEEQSCSHVKNPDNPVTREFLNLFLSFGDGIFDNCWNFTAIRPTMANAVFETPESMEAFRKLAEDDFAVYCFIDRLLYADVLHKGLSKGYGVECFIKELGIERENTYAFGDGMNDIQMFQNVEHSYAMGSARDVVKNAAKIITGSCTEDGIFNALKACGIVRSA